MSIKQKPLIFAGTPEFAAVCLRRLIVDGFNIALVLTQPDRGAGRGRKPKPSEVKQVAEEAAIPLLQPTSLKSPELKAQLDEFKSHCMIVVAYGLLIPQSILDLPELGCLNVHASLLPRWRGAAPIQRAIEAGDSYTGVCVMQMEASLDTGPVLTKATCEISSGDTAATLHDKLACLGADALVDTLVCWEEKKPIEQHHSEAIYAKKMIKSEAQINWSKSAAVLSCQIRAFNPWPVMFFKTSNELVVRIWEADLQRQPGLSDDGKLPGMILGISSDGIDVMTGNEVLVLKVIQLPGARPMSVGELLNGRPDFWKAGDQLG